jgi:hypothetical protein
MTNKEALIAVLGVSVPDLSADKVLLDAEITGADTYSAENEKSIATCAVKLLYGLLLPNISEGGYSISYNRDAIKDKIAYLSKQYELDDVSKPSIKSRNAW